MRKSSLVFSVLVPVVVSLLGCGDVEAFDDCLWFDLLEAETRSPSNVVLYFGVEDCFGERVSGLTTDQFVIREDGDVISAFESHQRVLPTALGFDLFSVLLLDMSGSIIESRPPDIRSITS